MFNPTVRSYRSVFAIFIAAASTFGIVGTAHAKLLKDGQTVTATFSSGNLKGQTFKLRYSDRSNKLGDRPVTSHSNKTLEIKTPGGWCKFHSGGNVACHNGKGKWQAR
jgi:hypothetical protein